MDNIQKLSKILYYSRLRKFFTLDTINQHVLKTVLKYIFNTNLKDLYKIPCHLIFRNKNCSAQDEILKAIFKMLLRILQDIQIHTWRSWPGKRIYWKWFRCLLRSDILWFQLWLYATFKTWSSFQTLLYQGIKRLTVSVSRSFSS